VSTVSYRGQNKQHHLGPADQITVF